MKLWDFLKRRMVLHGSKIAIASEAISYEELVGLIEKNACKFKRGRIYVIFGKTRFELALKILECLAAGAVAVPVDNNYGTEYIDNINKIIDKDKYCDIDIALIMFTSGTTGLPKGVMLSDEALIENIKAIDSYFRVNEGQKILISRPLVHIAVLTGEFFYGLYKGLQLDFYEEAFNPKRIFRFVTDNKIEIFCCTPTMLYHMYRYLNATKLTDIAVSGERLPKVLVDKLYTHCKTLRFYNVYGLTENSPRAAALLPEEFFDYPGSIGKPILNTEFMIENDELLLKSKSLMSGYYKRPDLTAKKIRNNILYTGDIAEVNKQGYYFIKGRKDNMIIRCGVNIFPEDLECALQELPEIQDCYVFGMQDLIYGEKIILQYVGSLSEQIVRTHLIKKIPAFMMPSEIQKVSQIEKTVSGKIKRKKSRASDDS